uniref:LAGLIDADG endonuclease n=1 Tax=Cordyceps blackwelliae TaxID=2164018 RepID=UPI00223805B7|nr:LAGLIDADG endonuclease [Cordyceps blackwelliae]UYS92280.1 LAGLIDADG endonuclease [Cordyceps blackwelliae]
MTNTDKFIRTRNELPIYLDDWFNAKWWKDLHPLMEFSKKHEEYLKFIYDLYKPYINTEPADIKVYNKKTNSYNEVLKFKTISLCGATQLIYYYELFYVKNSS